MTTKNNPQARGRRKTAAQKAAHLRELAAASAARPRPTRPVQATAASTIAADVQVVTTVQRAEALAGDLVRPSRTHPIVVITQPAGTSPFVDAEAVLRDVSGLAEVYRIGDAVASWAFSEALPPGCTVYGGASRVYPPGTDWLQRPWAFPPRFAYDHAEGQRAAREVTSDVMRCARLPRSAPATESSRLVQGTVLGATAGRAVVRLADGSMANIWTDLLAPDIPAERVASKGMQVVGQLDPTTRRLDVTASVQRPAEALATYVEGADVLAYVRQVERQLVILQLFPDFPVPVEPRDILVEPGTIDLRAVITEGETVVARVLTRGDAEDDWHLSLTEAGPASVAAPSVLAGGPPWLEAPAAAEELLASLDVDEVPAEEPVESEAEIVAMETPTPREGRLPARPVGAPAATGAGPRTEATGEPGADEPLEDVLQALTHERDQLARTNAQLRESAKRDQAQLRTMRVSVRELNHQLKNTRRDLERAIDELGRPLDDSNLFLDAGRQLRFEVEQAWARRIPATDKAARPLAAFTVGPDFFGTWASVEGISRGKVVEVIVEVLTGLADTLPGRELHPLRTSEAGNAPVRTRSDGATCWRASLQVNTPSARRLHFWRLKDGSVELSSVRLHDDFRA